MEIHAKKETTDMDEVFKEIRKRKFFYLKRNIATWKRAKAKHLKSNSEE